MNKIETRRFWLACCMIAFGIGLIYWGFYVPPMGEISSSVLGASGEILFFSGCLLSLDVYTTWKIHRYMDKKDE